jgi:hypothetical protein
MKNQSCFRDGQRARCGVLRRPFGPTIHAFLSKRFSRPDVRGGPMNPPIRNRIKAASGVQNRY